MKNDRAISMNIDKEIWKKVGILASELEMTKREVVESAIKHYKNNNDDKGEK